MIDRRHEMLDAAATIVLAGAATRGLRVATAETCTGGLIASYLSAADTEARWFEGGLIAATDKALHDLPGVPPGLLAECGAASCPVALAMANGIRVQSEADAGLAVTGYFTPFPDDGDYGRLFAAACSGERAECRAFHLGVSQRASLREHAALAGLSVLAGIIQKHPTTRGSSTGLTIPPR